MLKQTKLTPKRRENEPQLELESTAHAKNAKQIEKNLRERKE